MDLALYRELLAQARRLTRRDHEAEDLVQEALLAALETGRTDPAWLSGVIRNQAAMTARGAARRRRREADAATDASISEKPAEPDPQPFLQRLPPAARRVAILALHGLSADEIRWILQLTPAAFRQRLTSIRKTIGALPPELQSESLALAYVRDPARAVDLQFGLVRRALKSALHEAAGLGTHDPDGHLLVIRGAAHTWPFRGNG
ncbi:MAG TPA: sigma-70 family RNA polymerase sigma factor [Luteimonas sp.]|nr:sigma-70 family RNA polymerase sigma factor [Luteimonas sp.]